MKKYLSLILLLSTAQVQFAADKAAAQCSFLDITQGDEAALQAAEDVEYNRKQQEVLAGMEKLSLAQKIARVAELQKSDDLATVALAHDLQKQFEFEKELRLALEAKISELEKGGATQETLLRTLKKGFFKKQNPEKDALKTAVIQMLITELEEASKSTDAALETAIQKAQTEIPRTDDKQRVTVIPGKVSACKVDARQAVQTFFERADNGTRALYKDLGIASAYGLAIGSKSGGGAASNVYCPCCGLLKYEDLNALNQSRYDNPANNTLSTKEAISKLMQKASRHTYIKGDKVGRPSDELRNTKKQLLKIYANDEQAKTMIEEIYSYNWSCLK